MNKKEFINDLAARPGLPKSNIEKVLNIVSELIVDTLVDGESISLGRLGQFIATPQADRVGFSLNRMIGSMSQGI